jgi:hypothetical protein
MKAPTHIIPRKSERAIDIIIGPPHPRHTRRVVPETCLEMRAEDRHQDVIGRLLLNLGAEREPRAFSEESERGFVFFLGGVEA